MIKVICVKCKRELGEPGALLFGPPLPHGSDPVSMIVIKAHICQKCFRELLHFLDPEGQ